ncbi:MAG: pantoate--beta-alanine ligase [Planctomycetota bacterium]|nr:pantoate--beta-alanine ligase [Planctomycetota bacterium]MDA1105221.1 pantoate--beta-alanine ligase [Planctomycetota bacterium]
MRLLKSTHDCLSVHGCALVPTMGALHEGHLALCRHAAETGHHVVVSIFVNPTQFGPREDFHRYPRTLEADLTALRSLGTPPVAVFLPGIETVYPRGLEAAREEAMALLLPPTATQPALEDRCRPGHLAGVIQVVGRLFDLCRPATAVFGEKDFQQLRVIEDMVAGDPARFGTLLIHRSPTAREPDGLAMSSRNRFLDASQRERARALWDALCLARHSPNVTHAEESMRDTLLQHGLEPEYAVARPATSLLAACDIDPVGPCRALIAARLGSVRLIDNAAWSPSATA